MRTSKMRSTFTAFSIALAASLASFVTFSSTGDNKESQYDDRIDALETRVAVLEKEVGIVNQTTTQSNTTTQRTSSTNVSSQSVSSSSGNSSSYSATFSASGTNEVEIELDNAGTYTFTITGTSSFKVELVDAHGDLIQPFSMESSEASTLSATGELPTGVFTLRVETSNSWNATVTSSA